MIEYSQALLLISTTLVVISTIAYLGAVLAARMTRAAATTSADGVVVGEGSREVKVTGGSRRTPLRRFTVAWWAAKSTQLALLLMTGVLITRTIATGHAPFSNHYEFAIAFTWGMLLAQVYFEWRYRIRTMSVITLPVILAMLIYASTMSYKPNPLMPALQNSPLLTLHVFTASLGYGAALVSFAAAVMYLLAPYVKWKGWPSRESLDELGYKATVVTFPMLTLMLILGSIWGNVAWGRYWGLGSEGNGGSGHLVDLRGLSACPGHQELARQEIGMAAGAGLCSCGVYLSRQPVLRRSACLCLMMTR